jgi:Uma2 family endonuclease
MATQAPLFAPPERISFEEYLTAYDGSAAEWVDGAVVPMSPVSDHHQDIVDFLAALLRYLVEARDLGIVRTSQVAMHIGDAARVPDILFLSSEHLDRRRRTFVEGAADVVVEVVSPESRVRDRAEKFYDYEAAGVREFWLIDPLRETVDLFRLGPDGRYVAGAADSSGRMVSEVIAGFWIQPTWLWTQPLPKLQAVLGEWGLI